MKNPPRLMPALVTPFDRRGELDRAAHAHNVGTLAEMGIEGFLVAGSTGEGSLLEPGERIALVEGVRTTLGAKPFVIVGVWAESVRQAQQQIGRGRRARTPCSSSHRRRSLAGAWLYRSTTSPPLPTRRRFPCFCTPCHRTPDTPWTSLRRSSCPAKRTSSA